MTTRIRIGFPVILAIVLLVFPAMAAQASEVDFSCMSYKVWSKEHLSDRYRDFDIVLQNDCPGAVYWSMCIERVDPWTGKIVEEHIPTGYIEAEKKSRVNLHLNRNPDDSKFRNRFQAFYVNLGYEIDTAANVSCNASQCETKKHDLRAQVRANEATWERAEKSLAARVEKECPDTGWDTATREECAAKVAEPGRADMEMYHLLDQELRNKMAAIDPERCQVWSGDLTDD
jgi:hypothetical protein